VTVAARLDLRTYLEMEVPMVTKNERLKAAVNVPRRDGSCQPIEPSRRYPLVSWIASAFPTTVGERAIFKEELEQIADPASLLLLLIIPLLLLCGSCASFAILWIAIPFLGLSVIAGLLLFRHRTRNAQQSLSILARPPRSY